MPVSVGRGGELRFASIPILLDHLLRHILRITQRRRSSWFAVRASLPTLPTGTIHVIRAGAASSVLGDGFIDDCLPNLVISLRILAGLRQRKA